MSLMPVVVGPADVVLVVCFLLMVGLKAPTIFFPVAQPPLTLNPTPPLNPKTYHPPPPPRQIHKP